MVLGQQNINCFNIYKGSEPVTNNVQMMLLDLLEKNKAQIQGGKSDEYS